MIDIQSVTAEIKRGKKKEINKERKKERKKKDRSHRAKI